MTVRGPRWAVFLDGAGDGLLLAFAGWTLFYQVALVGQFSMLWAGWPWLALALVAMILCGLREVRSEDTDDADGVPVPAASVSPWLLAAGLALVAVAVVGRDRWGVWPVALVVVALVVVQVLPWIPRRAAATAPRSERAAASAGAHVAALLLAAAVAVLALFMLRPDADDAFYVNRATWVAEHGTAALNDTMFSPNTLPPAYSGGIPTPSIEALQGVLAHLLGLRAPTVCYLVVGPLVAALTVWTTWRLVRAWAPRRHGWVLLAAVAFQLASAASIVGNYSLGRIWQGKATAYAVLIPLVWLLLGRVVRHASRSDLVLLLAAGVAFVGLTTTSALMAPVIAGAALLAALVLRSGPLALGAAAFALGPVVNGLAQVFGPAAIGGGGDNAIQPPAVAFDIAFGTAWAMCLLTVLALACVPRLVPGAVGVLLGCGVIATMVALLPGVFELADALTGAGAVAWRLVIAMPTWVIVGLVVSLPPTAPARSGLKVVAVAVTAAVLAVPVLAGTWLWRAPGAELTSRPTWKVPQVPLADVRAVEAQASAPGRWLMPPQQMEVLSISRVGPFAVVPRAYYLPTLQTSKRDRSDRVLLFELVSGRAHGAERVAEALRRLDVSVACVPAGDRRARAVLRTATGGGLERHGSMRCHIDRG